MIFRILLTASALVAPIALPIVVLAQEKSITERWDGRYRPRGDALMRATILDAHNRERAAYGSNPLVWDNGLEADALAYARRLAAVARFAHDPQTGVRLRQGENLWMGTRRAFSYATMAGSWIDERGHFKPGQFPDISRTGNWKAVGHYTQMVWSQTNRVGCAISSNTGDDYLVCRYFPAGNVFGVAMR